MLFESGERCSPRMSHTTSILLRRRWVVSAASMYNAVVVKRLEGACSPPAHSVLHQGGERQQRTAGRQGGREGPEDRRIGWVTGGDASQQHFVELLLAPTALRFNDNDTMLG